MNKKLSKSDIKHLKAIAATLPACYTADNQKTLRLVTGAQLLSAGKEKTEMGYKIDPNGKYAVKVGEGVRVNHFKRLKAFCEQGRFESAQNYINEVAGINKGHSELITGMSSRTPKL